MSETPAEGVGPAEQATEEPAPPKVAPDARDEWRVTHERLVKRL